MDEKTVNLATTTTSSSSGNQTTETTQTTNDTDVTGSMFDDSTSESNIIKDSISMKKQQDKRLNLKHISVYKLPVVRKSQKEAEADAVRSLPSSWIPNTKKSKVIEKLMLKKQAEHEAILEGMKAKMSETNSSIEEDIRVLGTVYKQNQRETLLSMNDALANLRAAYKNERHLSQENFDNALLGIKSVYNAESEKIASLLQKLRALESYRIDNFKTFLQIAYQKLHKIAFKTPSEIEELFAQQLQDINEITLNNLRNYEELKLKLCLNLDNEVRLKLQEFQLIKMNWIAYIKLSVFTLLNEMNLFGEAGTECKLDPDVAKLIKSRMMPKLDITELDDWITGVQSVINYIDWVAKDIVSTFKTTVKTMFKSYFYDMKQIAEKIIKLGIIGENQIDDQIKKPEISCPEIAHLGKKFRIVIRELQNMWDNISNKLHKELQKTFILLNNFANLWEVHTQRIEEAKQLVLKDVEKNTEKCFLELSNIEVNINIALDVLRQEPDKDYLDDDLAKIKKLLDSSLAKYNANYDKECKLVEDKITRLIIIENALHVAEMNKFLTDMEKLVFENLETCEESEIEDLQSLGVLEKELTYCFSEINEIKAWRKKIYLTIDEYINTCLENTLKSIESWVTNQRAIFDTKKRLTVDTLHKSRYGRIKPVIYELRLAELKEHRYRYDQHIAALEAKPEAFSAKIAEFDTILDSSLLRDESQEAVRNKGKQASTILLETSTYKYQTEQFRKKLIALNELFVKLRDEEVDSYKKSNLNYIKAMKIFEEDGNFHPDEVKAMTTELVKVEKVVEKKLQSIQKQNADKIFKFLQTIKMIQAQIDIKIEQYTNEVNYKDSYKHSRKKLASDVQLEMNAFKEHMGGVLKTIDDIKRQCLPIVKDSEQIFNFQEQMGKMLDLLDDLRIIAVRPDQDIDAGFGHLEHVDFIFNFDPPEDDSFLGRCRRIINDSFETARRAAQNYYDGNRDLVTYSKMYLPTYEHFLEKTLKSHVYYYAQCELLWLEHIQDFIKMANDVKTYAKQFCKRIVNEYKIKSLKEIEEIHSIVTRRLADVRENRDRDFHMIYNRLKALHGHPNNKSKLDDLSKEVNDFLDKQNDVFLPSLNCCTCDLEDMQITYTSNMYRLAQITEKILDEVSRRNFTPEFNDKLENCQKFMANFIKNTTKPEDLKRSSSTKHSSSTKRVEMFTSKGQPSGVNGDLEISDYRQQMNIPTKCILPTQDFQKKKKLFDSNVLWTDEETPNIPNAINAYESVRLKITHALKKGVKNNDAQVKAWRELWNNEIEEVKKLYTVKYDVPKND